MALHKTVLVQVWVDVDEGIAQLVKDLNAIPGVRTYSSCQGTMGEGGPNPYPAYVTVSWDSDETRHRLEREFVIDDAGRVLGRI